MPVTNKTVAEHLIDFLERREVKHVFGLCGHTNIAVLAAMAESSIDFVTVRHEQIASHAADGYARVQGKASVVLSHLSPGLTNCATGVANAALDCIPMVVIAGDVPTHYYGKHPHQEVNLHADAAQWEIYRPFVKRAWRVDRPDLMAEILEKAFHLAESGQPGPVLVNVPMDVFSAVISSETFDRVAQNARSLSKPSLDDETARGIVEALAKSEKPVAYVGGGILLAQASEELASFVDHMGLPVAHSLMGKGALRDDHPLVLGMTGFWGTDLVNQTCLEADTVFAVGTRFKEADCSSWYPGYTFNIGGEEDRTKVIHIDIEPQEIGRNYPVEIGAVADAKAALRVGAGRVTVAVQPEAAALVGADCAALMLSLIDERGDWESLLELGDHSVLLLGPGLPVSEQTRAAVLASLAHPKHVVLDAGALSAFESDRASLFEAFKRRQALGYSLPVLTPHAGEFRRLFDTNIGSESVSTEDKRRLAQQAAAKAHAVIVAKGHNTVLASPNLAEAKLLPPGSPWLATSGTGGCAGGSDRWIAGAGAVARRGC